jgi:hypothetical protein
MVVRRAGRFAAWHFSIGLRTAAAAVVHPRMASEYHGVTAKRQLEPPGFMAMNYGYRTPLTTLLGQIVYGTTLGEFMQLRHAMASLTQAAFIGEAMVSHRENDRSGDGASAAWDALPQRLRSSLIAW